MQTAPGRARSNTNTLALKIAKHMYVTVFRHQNLGKLPEQGHDRVHVTEAVKALQTIEVIMRNVALNNREINFASL